MFLNTSRTYYDIKFGKEVKTSLEHFNNLQIKSFTTYAEELSSIRVTCKALDAEKKLGRRG